MLAAEPGRRALVEQSSIGGSVSLVPLPTRGRQRYSTPPPNERERHGRTPRVAADAACRVRRTSLWSPRRESGRGRRIFLRDSRVPAVAAERTACRPRDRETQAGLDAPSSCLSEAAGPDVEGALASNRRAIAVAAAVGEAAAGRQASELRSGCRRAAAAAQMRPSARCIARSSRVGFVGPRARCFSSRARCSTSARVWAGSSVRLGDSPEQDARRPSRTPTAIAEQPRTIANWIVALRRSDSMV